MVQVFTLALLVVVTLLLARIVQEIRSVLVYLRRRDEIAYVPNGLFSRDVAMRTSELAREARVDGERKQSALMESDLWKKNVELQELPNELREAMRDIASATVRANRLEREARLMNELAYQLLVGAISPADAESRFNKERGRPDVFTGMRETEELLNDWIGRTFPHHLSPMRSNAQLQQSGPA